MKTIVVGNGPVKRKLGKLIDSFDIVIRLNEFMPGYEEHIGTRTDIWGIGCPMPDKDYSRGGDCGIWPLFPFHSWDVVLKIVERESDPVTMKRFRPIDVGITKKLQKKAKHSLIGKTFTKTGVTAIEHAIEYFGNVHIVGFTFESNNIWCGPYDTSKSIPCHDDEKDKVYVEGLIKSGLVIKL